MVLFYCLLVFNAFVETNDMETGVVTLLKHFVFFG
jgi:hypothetical protein